MLVNAVELEISSLVGNSRSLFCIIKTCSFARLNVLIRGQSVSVHPINVRRKAFLFFASAKIVNELNLFDEPASNFINVIKPLTLHFHNVFFSPDSDIIWSHQII